MGRDEQEKTGIMNPKPQQLSSGDALDALLLTTTAHTTGISADGIDDQEELIGFERTPSELSLLAKTMELSCLLERQPGPRPHSCEPESCDSINGRQRARPRSGLRGEKWRPVSPDQIQGITEVLTKHKQERETRRRLGQDRFDCDLHRHACAPDDAQDPVELSVQREERPASAVVAECCVCMDCPATMCLVPCGHMCLCSECVGPVQEMAECPKCRAQIETVVRVYYGKSTCDYWIIVR